MRWDALLLLGLGHFLSSWALARAFEPPSLTAPDVFWYYYLVTATTVGYGDFAPQTSVGRLVAVLWIMPGSIALFTTAIAKGAQAMAESWRRNMRGGGDFSKLDDHIILVGWRGERSERLLDQLADTIDYGTPKIVILSDTISQNPAPDRAHFVKAESVTDAAAIRRAGVETASAAVVMAATDADALAASLSFAAIAPSLRVVAFFEDERMANLLKAHSPSSETAPSMSIELLARAARDAGSAELLHTLASSQMGPTEYSMVLPDGIAAVTFGAALTAFKRDHDATLLGIRPTDHAAVWLNPPWSQALKGGDRIYYVAESRLDAEAIDWPGLAKAGE